MDVMSLKCGNDVIVFDKDKQEIARGRASVGTQYKIGVELKSGKLYDELMKHPELIVAGGLKYSYLHFSEFSGRFIGFNSNDKLSDEVETLVKGIRAVNEFEFVWGICNSWFANYPGFRSAVTSNKTD